jgi:polysaccharide export outer membrane protein
MKAPAAFFALCLVAACDAGGRTLPKEDPRFGAPPAQLISGDDSEAQKILKEYERRFKEGYPLYPGDMVKFSVFGSPELSFSVRVPGEGFITYPLIGRVDLVGRTTADVQKELGDRLGRDYLVNPDITVHVEDYSKKKVYVLGSVGKPQDYDLPNGQVITLLQAIALAGGFRDDAEQHQVLLFRARSVGSQERITVPVNIVQLTAGGRGSDPVVIPDDIVFVPAREKIYVLGQVQHPGGFAIPSDHPTTVTQAISLAGGFTRIASESSVRLIRKLKDGSRATYVVNVSRVLGGKPEDDAPLQPGDVIFVPESTF